MGKDCIFCKIVKGEIPAFKLYEDDKCVVIMDKFPNTKGQSLVIVKEHVPYIMDLDDEIYSHAFLIAKKIGKAVDKALKPNKTCFVVEGFDVDHVHIKILPTYEEGLRLNIGPEATDEKLKEISEKIKEFLR